jgi:integrase
MKTLPHDKTTAPRKRAHKRGAGEGSVYQRSDSLWVASLLVGQRSDGKPDRRVLYARTRGDVQAKLDELRRRVSQGLITDVTLERDTLARFLTDRWLPAIRGTVRETTWKRYRDLVGLHIVPALGSKKLSALRPDHIQRFYADKMATGLSPRSVRYLHATLRRALVFAVKWGAVPRNVAADADPPALVRRELHPPSPLDIARLLDAATERGNRLAPLWTVAAYSGCRLGELLGLQWRDVDLAAGALSVRRTLQRVHDRLPVYVEPKTSRSRRTIILPSEAIEALRSWRARQAEERLAAAAYYAEYDLVFTSSLGTPLSARNVQRDFKAALSHAELPRSIRIHDLRHFAATVMLAAGVHPKVASERLGHSQVGITLDLYTHAVQSLDVDAAERIQRAIRGPLSQ